MQLDLLKKVKAICVQPNSDFAQFLNREKQITLTKETNLLQLLKRPDITSKELKMAHDQFLEEDAHALAQLEVNLKYEGYIARQRDEALKLIEKESIKIPTEFDYQDIPGLSNEVVQKLSEIKPRTIGQASRISGVTPAAISILLVYLKKQQIAVST